MKRVKVTIERETRKALLVASEDGRRGWIQRRWMAPDGTVAEQTLERAAVSLAEREDEYRQLAAWKNAFHVLGPAQRETDKAVAYKVIVTCQATGLTARQLCWFPKSQLRDGRAPGWLIIAKANEVREAGGLALSPCVTVRGLPSPDGSECFLF